MVNMSVYGNSSKPIILDLPFPPSVNSVWKPFNGRTILSRETRTWWALAEGMFLEQKRKLNGETIPGAFMAAIEFERAKRGQKDLQNLNKLPMDAAQKFGLIKNDRLCEEITERWSSDVKGCRVWLWRIG